MSRVFTIGHSNLEEDDFIGLLVNLSIEVVVDVRSKPRSRFYPHFNRKSLETILADYLIGYLYLGDELGGHPDREELYEGDRVIYERVVGLPEFKRGIRRVVDESTKSRLVLMCAEEDPRECHRHPLLASALQECRIQVLHLRCDGSVQDAAEMEHASIFQLPLVEPVGEDRTWRSPKPIPRRGGL